MRERWQDEEEEFDFADNEEECVWESTMKDDDKKKSGGPSSKYLFLMPSLHNNKQDSWFTSEEKSEDLNW